MRTSIYEVVAPERGIITDIDLAEPGPEQLLIRVLGGGVCTSDLPVWERAAGSAPRHLGHEPVGEVLATGPGVTIPVGTVVGGRISRSFARHALADAADVVVIPPGVDPAVVMPEPLGCVAEGLRRTSVPLGARVAVVGLGFMGLVMVQLLRNLGVAQLTAIDPREDARHAALANGADDARDGSQLSADAFFDVVVEASGSQAGLDLATLLVRPHGVLSILGYHQGRRQVDLRAWNWKAIDVVNAHVRDRDLLRRSTEAALQLQAAGRIDVGRLVTHRYRFEQIDEAFRALRAKPQGFIKAVIDIG